MHMSGLEVCAYTTLCVIPPISISISISFLSLFPSALRRKPNVEIIVYDACNQKSTTEDMQKFLSPSFSILNRSNVSSEVMIERDLNSAPRNLGTSNGDSVESLDIPSRGSESEGEGEGRWQSFEILDFASFDFFPGTRYTACLVALVQRCGHFTGRRRRRYVF